jgi:hypothetical protein
MEKYRYEDGINLEHTPGNTWQSVDDDDWESTPSTSVVTLPPGSIAALEESLAIAAARVVAADLAGFVLDFGANSKLKFTGRTVGAGTSVEWLEVRLRIERDKYGDALPIAHLVPALEHALRCSGQPNETCSRVIAYLQSIRDQSIVGAGDEHTADPEYRRTLSDRVKATMLQWWLEDAMTAAMVA